jgi:hypothetical protein
LYHIILINTYIPICLYIADIDDSGQWPSSAKIFRALTVNQRGIQYESHGSHYLKICTSTVQELHQIGTNCTFGYATFFFRFGLWVIKLYKHRFTYCLQYIQSSGTVSSTGLNHLIRHFSM